MGFLLFCIPKPKTSPHPVIPDKCRRQTHADPESDEGLLPGLTNSKGMNVLRWARLYITLIHRTTLCRIELPGLPFSRQMMTEGPLFSRTTHSPRRFPFSINAPRGSCDPQQKHPTIPSFRTNVVGRHMQIRNLT